MCFTNIAPYVGQLALLIVFKNEQKYAALSVKKQKGRHNIFIRLSKLICDIVNELFGLFPAKAGVGDGLAVSAFFHLLAAVNDIALDHKAFYDLSDIVVVAAAVENFVAYPDLLHKLLA